MTTLQNYIRLFSGLVLLLIGGWTAHAQCTFGWTVSSECNAASAIQMTLTGVAPFDVNWSGPSSGMLNNIGAAVTLEPLQAGVYTVMVTDASGCSNTQDVIVNPPAPITITGQVSPVTCTGGFDGAIAITVTEGSPPYTYNWSEGTSNTNTLSNLAAGTYTVTITDAAGCSIQRAFMVLSGSGLTATLQVVNACMELNNGILNVSVTGGLPPYEFEWSNGSNSEDLSNLSPGSYTVTIHDAAACTYTLSGAIEQVMPPDPAIISGNSTLCAGASTVLTASGGNRYLWSTGAETASVTVTTAGTYTVTVYTGNECSATASQEVTIQSSPTVSITGLSTICAGQTTVFTAQGAGTYQWSNGSTSASITILQSGTYTVTVTGASGCSATASRQLVVSPLPQALITGPQQVCPGVQATLVASGGGTYLWNTGATTAAIVVTSAGSYTVTVTNAGGCTASRTHTLQAGLTVNGQVVTNCANGGQIWLATGGGTAPYTYSWSNGLTTSNATNLPPGTYCITVTDATGCNSSTCFTITLPPAIAITEQIIPVCGSTTIMANAGGGLAPYLYLWSNGVQGPTNVAYASGNYSLTVTDANGCTAVQNIEIEVIPESQCGAISGKVVTDDNNNCLNDAEIGLSNWIVQVTSPQGNFYGVTQSDGFYVIGVPGGDTYEVNVIPPGSLWQPCAPAQVVVPAALDTVEGIDLPVQHPLLCPEMEVQLASGLIRRCSTSLYSIHYCNQGTAPAENAYIVLSMDALTTPASSNLPYIPLGNNQYRFNIGAIGVGNCGNLNVHFNVSCNASLGQTLCATAHIYPDSTCLPPPPQWSGASLALSGACSADSLRFHIKNVGYGPMNEALEYIVVEDHVMLLSAPVQLGAGQTQTVAVPANGSTWYLSVPQVPFHPGQSMPSIVVEGCSASSNFTTGLVNQFPADDEDIWLDIDCRAVTGSFDPNDKAGFPVGYGEAHYIAPGTPITYLVRFQNTGTDTAFTVRIVDTLSQWLDPATLRPAAASHPYTFDLNGEGVLHFLFENILLPDSNINEAASHGFVQFMVYPKSDTPLETVIENTAAIYFDFNEPVLTNTTRHRIGDHFVTVGLWQPRSPEYEIVVAPNPANGVAVITVKGIPPGKPLQLVISDAYGREVARRSSDNTQFRIEASDLPPGMYWFRILKDGDWMGSGKLLRSH